MINRTEIIGRYKPEKANLLLILHELQNSNPEHYVSKEDIIEVSRYLNLTYSSVYGVVTYYSMFSRRPRGKYLIRVCDSPVCDMDNSENIIDELKRILQLETGDTSSDRLFTLEITGCIGRCAESPCMIVNEKFFGNLTPESLNEIIENYKSGIGDD